MVVFRSELKLQVERQQRKQLLANPCPLYLSKRRAKVAKEVFHKFRRSGNRRVTVECAGNQKTEKKAKRAQCAPSQFKTTQATIADAAVVVFASHAANIANLWKIEVLKK